MSGIIPFKTVYSSKQWKDFNTLGNKKINEEVQSIMSQNENLQKISFFNQENSNRFQQDFTGQPKILKVVKKNKQTLEIVDKTILSQTQRHDIFPSINQISTPKIKEKRFNTENQADKKQQNLFKYDQIKNQSQTQAQQKRDTDIDSQISQQIENLKQFQSNSKLNQVLKQLPSQKINEIIPIYNNLECQKKENQDEQMNSICNNFSHSNQNENEIQNKQIFIQSLDLQELIKNSNKKNISEILSNHKDYVDHISGKCKCFNCKCNMMCKCGYQKLIINYKQKNVTEYQLDFSEKQQTCINQNELDSQIQVNSNCYYDQIKSQENKVSDELLKTIKMIDYNSYDDLTYNNRFKNKRYQPSLQLKFLTTNQVLQSFTDIIHTLKNRKSSPIYFLKQRHGCKKYQIQRQYNLQPIIH